MKCIGIIGAMEQEVAKIKEKMQDVTITSRARMDFYEGTLEGKKVVVVRSGIGKVNAGMCTQILADVFGVEAVINTGIAGSLNNDPTAPAARRPAFPARDTVSSRYQGRFCPWR